VTVWLRSEPGTDLHLVLFAIIRLRNLDHSGSWRGTAVTLSLPPFLTTCRALAWL